MKELNLLQLPFNCSLFASTSLKNSCDNAKWILPTQGYVKVNVYGPSKGNLGSSSIGMCIIDHMGHLIAAKSQSLSIG